MTAIINGIQYIGGQTAPNEFIPNQAATIDGTQTVEERSSCRTDYYSCYNNSNRDVGSSLMSKINVNTVDTQCGSTLTLGSSGTTVTLASGASQSGTGRTGTVDWCTTANSPGSPFTAVSGDNGFFVNTTRGAITVNFTSFSICW